jgi:O-antigen ligase
MVFTRRNLDWWCARGILALLLAMLVFAPLAFGAVDAWALLIVQGLAAGIFGLWIARLWLARRSQSKLLWPPLAWAVAAFVLYAVARYFTADVEYIARLETLQVILFGFLFFAIVNNLRGQEDAEAVSVALITVATLAAGYAVAQLLHHSNQVWNEYSPYAGRASGTFISPNNLAGFLALLLPLALAFLLVGKVSVITRILAGYAAVAMSAGLAVTFSRAGWVAAGGGIILVLGILLGHRNHRLKAWLLLLALLAGGGLFTTQYLSKTVGYMQRVAKPDDDGPSVLYFDSRRDMWRAAEQMWLDHVWCGVGPGLYDYRFREYRPESLQSRPDRVHNDYLNLLADWGAVGGALVLGGIVVFIAGLRRTWPHVRRKENDFGSGQSNRFAFFLGAMGGLAALAIHSLMDFNLHIPANALAGVTLLALVASNLRLATEAHWFRAGRPAKLALTGALVAVAAVLLAQQWRGWPEARWLARAEWTEYFSPARAAALEKAFAAEPGNFQTAYEIGECYREQSFTGGSDYAALARQAMTWYARAIRANPHDGYSFLRTGMCLDWLGQHAEAEKFFSTAESCDPNGYFMAANIGWHHVQTGDYAAARQWFERSALLNGNNNTTAWNYLRICEAKLKEAASGQPRLPTAFFDQNAN